MSRISYFESGATVEKDEKRTKEIVEEEVMIEEVAGEENITIF